MGEAGPAPDPSGDGEAPRARAEPSRSATTGHTDARVRRIPPRYTTPIRQCVLAKERPHVMGLSFGASLALECQGAGHPAIVQTYHIQLPGREGYEQDGGAGGGVGMSSGVLTCLVGVPTLGP